MPFTTSTMKAASSWSDDAAERAHGLALALAGPQVLAEARLVVADQRVGGVEDVPVRPVVLLELDQLDRLVRRAEIALELLHVGDLRAAERVDRLVVVADREHRRMRAREHPQPFVLQRVRVLELVDEQVREAAAVVLAQALVPGKELVAAQQQLGEIDDAFALAHRVVERVVLDLPARQFIGRLHHVRALALLLGIGDEPLELLRRVTVVVQAVRAIHALDQRQLVLRVEDLEELRQVRVAMMRAQHAVAQAVKGAHPHPARVHRRERRQADQHLFRRLVGERDREDRQRPRLSGRQQPGNARREHARLAAAGARQDQRGRMRQRDRRELLGIQVFEERRGHATNDSRGTLRAIIARTPPT